MELEKAFKSKLVLDEEGASCVDDLEGEATSCEDDLKGEGAGCEDGLEGEATSCEDDLKGEGANYEDDLKGEGTSSEDELVTLDIVVEWKKIQDELRTHVIPEDTEQWESDFTKLTFIAGLDISTPKEAHSDRECSGVTAIAIFSFPSLEVVYEEVEEIKLKHPYVPGFLAFRESPAVIQLVEKVRREKPEFRPDVLLIDGNGLLHPQRCGLACHIGLKTNIPTIGVAKNLHHVEGLHVDKRELQGIPNTGDFISLKSDTGEVLGVSLKTSDESKNPVYVSIGHKISLETARRVVLQVSKYRVPEPIRVADHISRALIRKTTTGRGRDKLKNKCR